MKCFPFYLIRWGPGVITGASDDDPSGIGTYSQAGARYGLGFLWTMFFSYPLMASIQIICATLGRVSGVGIAANLREHYPRPLLYFSVGLLVVANTLNLAADLGAMGACIQMLLGTRSAVIPTFAIGVLSLLLEVFVPYSRYVFYLRWLCLSLLFYVATTAFVSIDWGAVAWAVVFPRMELSREYISTLCAVFGTTISPYLFFWQASQESEEKQAALSPQSENVEKQARRIRLDTAVGMAVSNAVGFFIILTSAAVLHVNGITEIESANQAALALKPLAGPFAFLFFSMGIVGTGLLAIPVLAGSSAYAVAETFQYRAGLERPLLEAKAFYGVIGVSIFLALVLNLADTNPIRALFWSAALNAIAAVPLLFMLMHMSTEKKVVGDYRFPSVLRLGGWATTVVMLLIAVAMAWVYWA